MSLPCTANCRMASRSFFTFAGSSKIVWKFCFKKCQFCARSSAVAVVKACKAAVPNCLFSCILAAVLSWSASMFLNNSSTRVTMASCSARGGRVNGIASHFPLLIIGVAEPDDFSRTAF